MAVTRTFQAALSAYVIQMRGGRITARQRRRLAKKYPANRRVEASLARLGRTVHGGTRGASVGRGYNAVNAWLDE